MPDTNQTEPLQIEQRREQLLAAIMKKHIEIGSCGGYAGWHILNDPDVLEAFAEFERDLRNSQSQSGGEALERAARAICVVRGLNPDCLHEHHEWEDWPVDERQEYSDPFTGEPRVRLMHRGWRNRVKDAEAALSTLASHPTDQPRADERLREALEKAREFVVLFLAFDGRDRGSDRMEATLDGLVKLAVETDNIARAALSDAPQPAASDVVEAGKALLAKLDECQPHIDAAFVHRQLRCGDYTGPQYGKELDAFRAALAAIQGEGRG